MTMRNKNGVLKPKQVLSLLTATISPIRTTIQKALNDPNWNSAVNEEYDVQIVNKTWSLVPRPKGTNIVNSMWLHKHKLDADGEYNQKCPARRTFQGIEHKSI